MQVVPSASERPTLYQIVQYWNSLNQPVLEEITPTPGPNPGLQRPQLKCLQREPRESPYHQEHSCSFIECIVLCELRWPSAPLGGHLPKPPSRRTIARCVIHLLYQQQLLTVLLESRLHCARSKLTCEPTLLKTNLMGSPFRPSTSLLSTKPTVATNWLVTDQDMPSKSHACTPELILSY